MKALKNYIMLKGVELFCDNTPTWIIKLTLPGVDHIKLRNGLSLAARIASKQ